MAKLSDLVLRDVTKGTLPKFLYKYRPIDSTLEKIIEDNSLWFANPLSFNDPFDCQIQIDTQNTIGEIHGYIKKNSPKMGEPEINRIVAGIIADPTYWPRILKGVISKSINSKGICCFSSHNESILMWSHYTNCHKGVSLKYDITIDPEFFVHPMKVDYRNDYPKYNHIKHSDSLVKLLIQAKSNIWKYEDEVRILKNNMGVHHFDKKALVEVTFGCNCEKKDMDRIRKSMLKHGYHNTVFSKASIATDRYQLEFSNF